MCHNSPITLNVRRSSLCETLSLWTVLTLVASLYGVLEDFCTPRLMVVTGPSVIWIELITSSVVLSIMSKRLMARSRNPVRPASRNQLDRSPACLVFRPGRKTLSVSPYCSVYQRDGQWLALVWYCWVCCKSGRCHGVTRDVTRHVSRHTSLEPLAF